MSETPPPPLVSRKSAELAFAAILAGGGIVLMIGALEMDIGWSRSGPEAGYFPFRIGLLMLGAALFVMAREAFSPNAGRVFLTKPEAANILRFALPLLVLVAAIPWLGMYLAATTYLAFTLRIMGRHGWRQTLAIAFLAPATAFLLFEFGFRTPLPKGPLGPLLGML